MIPSTQCSKQGLGRLSKKHVKQVEGQQRSESPKWDRHNPKPLAFSVYTWSLKWAIDTTTYISICFHKYLAVCVWGLS